MFSGYVSGNPLNNTDSYGLDAYTCRGMPDIYPHSWFVIKSNNEIAIGWNPNTLNENKFFTSPGHWIIEKNKNNKNAYKLKYNNCNLIETNPLFDQCILNLVTTKNNNRYNFLSIEGDNCFSATEKAISYCKGLMNEKKENKPKLKI